MNNIHNKLITKDIIEGLVNKYASGTTIQVKSLELFQQAFIHKDLCSEKNNFNDPADEDCVMSTSSFSEYGGRSNERLEFIGDSIVGAVVAEYLFDTFPHKDEGFLTRIRSKIVRKEKMAYYADQLNFREYLLLSSHLERIHSRENPRLMEDIFESFIGSLYKDQSFEVCKSFIHGILKHFINLNELVTINDNFKDSLLRYFQSQKWNYPIYSPASTSITTTATATTTTATSGRKKNCFEIVIKLNKSFLTHIKFDGPSEGDDYIIGYGKASTKKQAEQLASKDALIRLGVSLNY